MLYNNEFWKSLVSRSDKDIACFHKGKYYTCKYIRERSLRMAVALSEKGFEKGDRVVLALEPGPEFIIALYACLLLGAKTAIIDPHMGRQHYQAMLKQFSPSWAFMDSRLILLQEHPVMRWIYLQASKEGIYLPTDKRIRKVACGRSLPLFTHDFTSRELMKKSFNFIQMGMSDNDDECLVVYTSGTTGVPKAVVHTYGSLAASLDLLTDMLSGMNVGKIATHLPHFVLLAIQSNMIAYIWQESMSASRRFEFLRKHQIDCLFGPPSEVLPLVDYCMVQDKKLPETLSQILLGSAPVYRSFLYKLMQVSPIQMQVACIYGMTEHLIVSMLTGLEKMMDSGVRGDFVGYPVPGVETRIGLNGNLMIRSPQLYRRYFHQEDLVHWHDTGDRASLVAGKIFLIGRDKNMIIRKNTNIYPEMYEPGICSLPGVRDAAMVGIYDESIEDERVYLAIETEYPDFDLKALWHELRRGANSIHRDALPEQIILTKIPRKGRQQKLDRQTLQNKILCKIKESSLPEPVGL